MKKNKNDYIKPLRRCVKAFVLLLLVVFSFACKDRQSLSENGTYQLEKPDVLLSKEEIVPILVEYHIAEAECLGITGDNSIIEFMKREQEILKEHGTDSLVFKDSYNYYLKNVYELKGIYQNVLDSLQARKEALEK